MSTDLESVSVTGMRKALRDLWRSEALHESSTIRAHTHNLIVYTEDAEAVNSLVERIISVVSERPGRAILINSTGEDKPGIESYVTAFCKQVRHKQICAELVVINTGTPGRDELHSTVLALAAPELPVYTVWMAPPTAHDHLLEHLIEGGDELIVDSSLFTDPLQSFIDLAALAEDTRMGDLNWRRLMPWRRWLAQFWDVEDLQPALNYVDSLDIHVNAAGGRSTAQALLLAGWLADRLGWHPVDAFTDRAGGYVIQWQKFDETGWGGKIEIVRGAHHHLPPGALMSIFIQAGEEPPYVMPRLQVNTEGSQVEMRLDDAAPHGMHHTAQFRPLSTAQALALEIDYGQEPHFRSALKKAAEIAALLQKSASA